MPTYTYRCDYCDREHQFLRPINRRDDPAQCPECGLPMDRALDAPAVNMNGQEAAK